MFRKKIGPYEVLEELGTGGMGSVYLVRRKKERFALKVVHERIVAHPASLERFRREVGAGTAIDHPNVVRTFDHGEHKGTHFMVMEYVEGRTLRSFLEAWRRVPEALLREVARQSADGLAAIHAAGIVHRDIKPENILITDANEIRIMDLGVAKLLDATVELTTADQFAGTAPYASPEQFQGTTVGPAADLYALGVVLYELASGANPFWASELVGIVHRHLTLEPEPLDRANEEISGFFSAVVAQLLAKAPAERFESASALRDVLSGQERSAWWAAREAAALAAARPGVPVRRETALVGREEVLEQLNEAWAAARDGAGNMVVLQGEPGIGKTRLADAFLAGIEPGEAHLVYAAFRATGGLGGIVEGFVEHFGAAGLDQALSSVLVDAPAIVPSLAARLRNDAPPPGAPELAGDTLRAAFVRLLQSMAKQTPTVLVVDDLHHARQEGQDLLVSLSRALAGHRILLVGLTQPGGMTAGRRIDLPRLDEKKVARLLTKLLSNPDLARRLAPKIAEESDGVPLVALELIRGLEDAGTLRRQDDGVAVAEGPISEITAPDSLRELIETRLDSLDDEDRELLDAACVQGPEFDPGLLAATLETKRVRVLRRLASIERRTGMVRARREHYRFDLKQMQEVLEHDLTDQLRCEYHALLCDAHLEQAGEPDAEFLARHALLGTRPDEAREWLGPALESLSAAYRHTEFIALARLALGAERLLVGDERAKLLLDLAEQLDFLGLPDEKQAALLEANAATDDLGLRARARYLEAVRAFKTGRLGDAETLFAECADLARAAGDRLLTARATGGRGSAIDHSGRHAEALTHLREYLVIAEEERDRIAEKMARQHLGICYYNLGRLDEAEAEMRRACELARELGDRRGEAHSLSNLSQVATLRNDPDGARRLLRRAIELGNEIGDRRIELLGSLNLGTVDMRSGHLAEADRLFASAVALARELGDPRIEGHVEIHRSTIRAALGRFDQALERVDRAAEVLGGTRDADQRRLCRQRRAQWLFALGRGPEPEPDDYGQYRQLFDSARRGDEQGALDFDNPAYGIAPVWTRLMVLQRLSQATGKIAHLERAREYARALVEHAPEADREHAEAHYAEFLSAPT